MSDYDSYDEDEWNEGHPFAATLIGVVLLVAGGWFALPYIPPKPLPIVMAAALVIAGVLWGIGYLITIRRATANWKLLSFMVLLLVTAGVGYSATILVEQRIKADLQTMVDTRVGIDGLPVTVAGAEKRGPFSKLFVAFVRQISDDQRKLDAQAKAIGLDGMADASGVQRNPILLRNCAKLGELKTAAHDAIERRREGIDTMMKGFDNTDYPEEFKRGVRTSMLSGRSGQQLDRIDTLQGQFYDAVQGACNVLARRHWQPQGPVFMFTSRADLDAFDRYTTQQNQAVAELQRINADSQAAFRASQMNLRRHLSQM